MEKSAIFQSFTPEERAAIGPFTRRGSFAKGAVIFHAGQQVAELGIVLSGSVHIEANDLWGNRSILGHVAAGEVFAETYACVPGTPMMVSSMAASVLPDPRNAPDTDCCAPVKHKLNTAMRTNSTASWLTASSPFRKKSTSGPAVRSSPRRADPGRRPRRCRG